VNLRDQLQTDLETLIFNLEDFGQTVSYQAKAGGAAVSLTAIVNPGRGEEYRGSDALDVRASLLALVADVTDLRTGDTFTFGGDVWAVVSGEKVIDGRVWRAEISRTAYT